jgi:hypothetical protein
MMAIQIAAKQPVRTEARLAKPKKNSPKKQQKQTHDGRATPAKGLSANEGEKSQQKKKKDVLQDLQN